MECLEKKNLHTKIDLFNANLFNADLRSANLGSTNLRNANLRNTNLHCADLRNAKLSYADLFNAHLRSADLHSANLGNADLRYADLSYANLDNANLGNADLSNANLDNANLGNANFSGVDLSSFDFSNAHLSNANLSNANLSYADLRNANLSYASLDNANLSNANLSYADLSYANLDNADLSNVKFSHANLSGVDLSGFDLRKTNLSGVDLHNSNVSNVNLQESQVLYANFTQAILTGACIADWQIGSSTILKDVTCEYIFRTYDEQEKKFSGRLPVDSESTFAPGEFTQRFQIIASALETIDITFTEGIDWQAFFQSFQALRDHRPNEDISIQGMERKGDAFVVRLEVETEADKAAIETEVKQLYAQQLAALEAQYQERLRLQGVHLEDAQRTIEAERQKNTELIGVIGIVAQNQGAKYDFRNSNVGQFVDTAQAGSRVQNIQHIYAPEQQDLREAAKEIQALLNTLAETYNTTTDAGQEKLMQDLGSAVEKHPKWRRALKEGGIELIKVLFAPIGVPLEMARVYLEPDE
ncbi:MAG: pentapeptide repeat-containing protein [Leptolyngbyaceae cyanobacterium]